ncbi:MAG: PHP domain-containing protein [Candidatus Nitrosopolaris sp.]
MYAMNLREDYHIHSNYNDHSAYDLTIPNVVKRAEELNLQTIAFTEHVRKTSSWLPEYLREIESFSKNSSVKIIPGFEAKILVDGSINCPEEYSKNYFLIASFHTLYNDKSVWLNALTKAIENPSVDVIGHIAPETTFRMEVCEVQDLAFLIVKNKKIIEINAKYHRPPREWIVLFMGKGVKFHLGSDAHRLGEIGQFARISDLISPVINQDSRYI